MRIFTGFTMFFYTIVFLAIGGALIAFSLNMIAVSDIMPAIEYAHDDINLRLTTGLVGALLIMYSLVAIQIALGNFQREKTIAFENPSGRVTISMSAIEDFIKRAAAHIPEIKELRANVKATKKGINITNRVFIYSDANIPDTTEKIQNILKNKIQDMLGIEEPISIKVHIAKIVTKEAKGNKAPAVTVAEEKRPTFRGIEYGEG